MKKASEKEIIPHWLFDKRILKNLLTIRKEGPYDSKIGGIWLAIRANANHLREGANRERPRNKTKEENSIAGPNLMVLRFCQILERQARARRVLANISQEKIAQVHEGENVIWPWVQSKMKRSLKRTAQPAKMVRQERVEIKRSRKESRQFFRSPFSKSSESPINAVLNKLANSM